MCSTEPAIQAIAELHASNGVSTDAGGIIVSRASDDPGPNDLPPGFV